MQIRDSIFENEKIYSIIVCCINVGSTFMIRFDVIQSIVDTPFTWNQTKNVDSSAFVTRIQRSINWIKCIFKSCSYGNSTFQTFSIQFPFSCFRNLPNIKQTKPLHTLSKQYFYVYSSIKQMNEFSKSYQLQLDHRAWILFLGNKFAACFHDNNVMKTYVLIQSIFDNMHELPDM